MKWRDHRRACDSLPARRARPSPTPTPGPVVQSPVPSTCQQQQLNTCSGCGWQGGWNARLKVVSGVWAESSLVPIRDGRPWAEGHSGGTPRLESTVSRGWPGRRAQGLAWRCISPGIPDFPSQRTMPLQSQLAPTAQPCLTSTPHESACAKLRQGTPPRSAAVVLPPCLPPREL